MPISTQQYQTMRQSLAVRLAANDPRAPNPSYATLLNLFNQLATDAAGAPALAADRMAAMTGRFRQALSGTNAAIVNPNDAQVSDFMGALSIDYAGAAAPSSVQYLIFLRTLAELLSPGQAKLANPTTPRELFGYFANSFNIFSGNFASLFPTALQVIQSDRGLQYAGPLTPAAGNTSTATFTLVGGLPVGAPPVAIMVRLTGTGTTADLFYDGGTTPVLSGVAVVAGTPINLPGAGSGLFVSPNAGTQVAGDSWRAACASLADQTANGRNVSAAPGSTRPIISPGLNGKVGILFDGVDDELVSASYPRATPSSVIVIGRWVNPVLAQQIMVSARATSNGLIYTNTGSRVDTFNGAFGPSILPFTSTAFQRIYATFTASAADVLRVGALSAGPGPSTGNGVPDGLSIGHDFGVSQFGNVEVLCVIVLPGTTSLVALDAALNSAAGYGVGAIAV